MKRPRPLPRRTLTSAAPSLTARQLFETWAAYKADRADVQLRNRLVEHYLPWVYGLATSIAERMRLSDVENAVGEVLAALVASIVPDCDGPGEFTHWASVCIQRNLIAQQRRERMTQSIFDEVSTETGKPLEFDEMPAGEKRSLEASFLQVTRELTDRQAMVLWLKFQRGLSNRRISRIIHAGPDAVRSLVCRTVKKLRKKNF